MTFERLYKQANEWTTKHHLHKICLIIVICKLYISLHLDKLARLWLHITNCRFQKFVKYTNCKLQLRFVYAARINNDNNSNKKQRNWNSRRKKCNSRSKQLACFIRLFMCFVHDNYVICFLGAKHLGQLENMQPNACCSNSNSNNINIKWHKHYHNGKI